MASELVPIAGPEVIEPISPPEPIRGSSVLDMPPAEFQAGLDRRRLNHKALIQWVASALVEGTDFGKIHVVGKDKCDKGKWCKNESHFSKPVLFKPGSEKICGMLGVIPCFPTLKDYEAAAVSGVKIETIILRCELRDAGGRILAEGVGARSVSKDYGDVNKALKMAEKSGQIDATLRLAGLSEVFTQDLEDMVAPAEIVPPEPPQAATNGKDEDLSPLLEASLRQEPSEDDEAREDLRPPLIEDRCKECNGAVGSYVSRKGVPYYQCEFAHELFLDLMAKGKSKQFAGTMTRPHFYQVVP